MHHSGALRIPNEREPLVRAGLALFVQAIYDVVDTGLGGGDEVIARGILESSAFSTDSHWRVKLSYLDCITS